LRSPSVVAVLAPFALLVLLPAAAAHAQAPAARLDVDANPACSSRDELVARVAARSTRIRFVNDGAGVPSLAARIDVGPRGGVIAELIVVEPDGRRFSRRLEAPSCAAATDALALVVAITLDPSVATGDGSKAPPPPDTATPAAGTPAGTPGPAPPPPPPPAAGPEAGTAQTAAPQAAATPGPASGYLTAGVSGGAIQGPAPTLMAGLGLEVQAGLERGSVLSPALMLSLTHAWSGDVIESDGTAAFSMDLVALDICPARVVLLRLEARACAAGSFGRLAAHGSNTFDPTSVVRPFATAGGAARLAVPFGARIQVGVRLGAGATLWRDAFEFTPKVFHRAASVTLVGDVGIGVRFP
jgi:hypothetical protein